MVLRDDSSRRILVHIRPDSVGFSSIFDDLRYVSILGNVERGVGTEKDQNCCINERVQEGENGNVGYECSRGDDARLACGGRGRTPRFLSCSWSTYVINCRGKSSLGWRGTAALATSGSWTSSCERESHVGSVGA